MLDWNQLGAKKQHTVAAGKQAQMTLVFLPGQLLKNSLAERQFLSGPAASCMTNAHKTNCLSEPDCLYREEVSSHP